MISNIIYNEVASNFSTKFTKAKDFFLEKAVGNKNILIKTIASKNPIKSIKSMRFAKLYVVITGWKINDAMKVADELANFISDIRGEHSLDAMTYEIKEIVIDPFPAPDDSKRNEAAQVVFFGVGVYYLEN